MESREEHLTYNIVPTVEALTPGSGTYLNEANFGQLNWQNTFYGENWKRLYDIKQKYDPDPVLYACTEYRKVHFSLDSLTGFQSAVVGVEVTR